VRRRYRFSARWLAIPESRTLQRRLAVALCSIVLIALVLAIIVLRFAA
jgi:hypothetical protein